MAGTEPKKLSLDKETVQRLRGSVPGLRPTPPGGPSDVPSDSRCCCPE